MPRRLSLADRRAQLLTLLAQRGPLSLTQMQAALGVPRHAVERALGCEWFVRTGAGRGAPYDLTARGREEARRAG